MTCPGWHLSFTIKKQTSGDAYKYDAGADRHELDGGVRFNDLNSGNEILITDTDGDVLESTVTIETAPTGGSGLKLAEYASSPTSPPTGFVWIEAKNAKNKTLNYYDGTDTYQVDLSI